MGLALLAFAVPTGEQRGEVVLNSNPPQAPRSGSKWESWELPQPGSTASASAPAPSGNAGGAPPAEYIEGGGDAAAIWATPAEFSETD